MTQPTRLFIDCSHVDRGNPRRGVDRVVMKVLEHAPAVCSGFRVVCEAVAWSGDGSFRLIPSVAERRSAAPRLDRMKLGTNRRLERAGLSSARRLLRKTYRRVKERRRQNLLKNRPAVRFGPGDVLFCPDATWVLPPAYVDSLREPHRQEARIVPLFYDLIPVSHPEYLSDEYVAQFRRWLDALLSVADFGLAISDTTRKGVEQYAARLGIDFEAATTYLGADFEAASAGPARVREDLERITAAEPYLVVGALEPRKNHTLVLRAFELLWRRGSEATLCFIGSLTPLSDPLVREMRASTSWGSRLFLVDDADDDALSFCYRNAKALIAPSVAEGFDLPTVEALHHSLPVFASRTPLHEEIVGTSAVYFDPQSAEDLAAQIAERQEREQAAPEFRWLDWETSVRRMVELLLEPRDTGVRDVVHDSPT